MPALRIARSDSLGFSEVRLDGVLVGTIQRESYYPTVPRRRDALDHSRRPIVKWHAFDVAGARVATDYLRRSVLEQLLAAASEKM